MRWVAGIVFVCLIMPFVVVVERGRGDACPSFPEVKLSVVPTFANPVYDFSTGIPEIQTLANDVVHQVRMGWALGFTQTQPLLEMDAPVRGAPAGKGQFCARPRYIKVMLGTRSETVNIPREIPSESCGFREIMEHERKHQDVNRQIIQKYTALTEQKFADYLKSSAPLRGENVDQVMVVQQNMLRSILDEVAVKMIAENAARQQDVDSPDEYARLLHVCNGELADVVRRTRDQQSLVLRE